MRNLLLAATLVIAGACTHSEKDVAETPSASGPRFGRIVTLYQVLDEDTQERVGFVELTRYDGGREIYWVRSVDRKDKLGYIHTNNKAYKYVWHAGQRAEQPEFIGADTISANARRIIGHGRPVELVEMSLRELAAEIQPGPEPQMTDEGDESEEGGDGEE